jgi:hypothetical protein
VVLARVAAAVLTVVQGVYEVVDDGGVAGSSGIACCSGVAISDAGRTGSGAGGGVEVDGCNGGEDGEGDGDRGSRSEDVQERGERCSSIMSPSSFNSSASCRRLAVFLVLLASRGDGGDGDGTGSCGDNGGGKMVRVAAVVVVTKCVREAVGPYFCQQWWP